MQQQQGNANASASANANVNDEEWRRNALRRILEQQQQQHVHVAGGNAAASSSTSTSTTPTAPSPFLASVQLGWLNLAAAAQAAAAAAATSPRPVLHVQQQPHFFGLSVPGLGLPQQPHVTPLMPALSSPPTMSTTLAPAMPPSPQHHAHAHAPWFSAAPPPQAMMMVPTSPITSAPLTLASMGVGVGSAPVDVYAYSMNTTTSATTKAHTYSNRVGLWTRDEHERFLQGLDVHGRGNWSLISKIVKTRTTEQVRSHAQKHFQRIDRKRSSDGEEEGQTDQDTLTMGARTSSSGDVGEYDDITSARVPFKPAKGIATATDFAKDTVNKKTRMSRDQDDDDHDDDDANNDDDVLAEGNTVEAA